MGDRPEEGLEGIAHRLRPIGHNEIGLTMNVYVHLFEDA
jgi:hypothetical protein